MSTDLIPCEYCNLPISPHAYFYHVQHYHRDISIPITHFLSSNEINSDDIEEDIYGADSYITSSQQINGNLREFLYNHFGTEYPTHNSPGSSPPSATLMLSIPRETISYTTLENLEDVPKSGVSDIDAISILVNIEDKVSETLCAICQDSFKPPIRRLNCLHMYCDICIRRWMKRNKKCPLCQTEYN